MSEAYWSPVRLSFQIATISTIIVVLIGIWIGFRMARSNHRFKIVLDTIFLMPMVLPPTVIGFFLIKIFGKNSFVGQAIEGVFGHPIMFTWWAGVIACFVVSFPLMYQSSKAAFEKAHVNLEEAAADLGATRRQTFFQVILPIAKPFLISGAILAFVRGLGEFGATLMFAGNIPGRTQTIPTAIYFAIDSGNTTLSWMLVVTTMLMSFSFLAITQYLTKKPSSRYLS